MSEPFYKAMFPLSRAATCVVVLEGEIGREELGRLGLVFNLIESALLGKKVPATDTADKVEKQSHQKSVSRATFSGTCQLHPESEWNTKRNRCQQCIVEKSREIALRTWARRRAAAEVGK